MNVHENNIIFFICIFYFILYKTESSNYIKSRLLVCLVASFLVCHVIGRYHIIRFVLTLWLVDCKFGSILNQLSQFNMIFFQWESQNTVSIQYIFCNNFYNTNDAKAVFPFHSFYISYISRHCLYLDVHLEQWIWSTLESVVTASVAS